MNEFKKIPTSDVITEYVNKFNSKKENYFEKEAYIAALILTQKFKANDNNFQNIFIKVNFINGAFNTAIMDTFGLSKFIYYDVKNIDINLECGKTNLVYAIRDCYKTKKSQKGFRENYSFATKYCHCHYPKLFPIYDKYVAFSLFEFNKINSFSKFHKKDLLDYDNLKKVLEDFKLKFNCKDVDNTTLDRFLWSLGRKYISN